MRTDPAKRLELHEILCGVLGSRNVYFQPPETVKLHYPALIYSRSRIDRRYADNAVYTQETAYDVTVVYKDPDSDIPERISRLPWCRFVRHYVSDNLIHDVFTLYH